MPPQKQKFNKLFENLQEIIDVDDSAGRTVPINMNFVEEAFLTKDTGFTLFGKSESEKPHSLFLFKKKDGTKYPIRAKGTKLQQYNYFNRSWDDIVGSPNFTEDAEFGYVAYDNELWFCNGVESLYKWTGSAFTEYASAPKGNILEMFEDRLFIAGVTAEPLTVYYSNTGAPETWTPTDIFQPTGTDKVMNLKNYYGVLMVFKEKSIWKMTFIYLDPTYVPKLDQQSGNYGCVSKKGVAWVENDLWFFTGIEVRAIGFADQQTGVFGINKSVISEDIKETLKNVLLANYSKVVTFYNDRRFYLAVPLVATTNDTLFVCHTLYNNSWTKYSGRDKAHVGSSMIIDDHVYTSTSSPPYGVLKWEVETADSEDLNNTLVTES